jgi:hypothetical protein
MTTSHSATLQEAIDDALHSGRVSRILCPAHDDSTPSLVVRPGSKQPVVFRCHAGCEQDQIIAAGEVDISQVCNPLDEVDRIREAGTWTPAGEASHVYPYRDEDGNLLYEVLRVPTGDGSKRFLQRRPDPTAAHGHSWNLEGVRRTIYRLPEVRAAVRAGHTIHIAEGEKCVDALLGVIPEGDEATCNSGGAGKWMDEFSSYLAGANCVVYADSDDPGHLHARAVRDSLLAVGATVAMKEAPAGVLQSGKKINDVADHLQNGRSLDDLLVTTPETEVEKAMTGIDILDLVGRPIGRTEYAIEGTLAKGERAIIIGFEGSGKSTLLRQIAVMTAAGMHPFSGRDTEPRRVLYIDAENHPDQVGDSWRGLSSLAARHGHEIERGMLTIMEEYEGEQDLASEDGASWLQERVWAYKPDLVVMGPLTNLAARDLRDDEPARKIRNAVNKARAICNSAWIMEHHAPHKNGMDKERPVRPYGSSLFLKWPDYGYGLKPTDDPKVFEWIKNRGPRVRSRQWPDALREGEPNTLEWPWMETVITE